MSARWRLEVWGDPIAHSRSPQLHSAAYRTLGLDWQYGRRQVSVDAFPAEWSSLDESWRGLSLTMPLKEIAHRTAASLDRHAALTGAVNTLLLGDEVRGYNTDVGGIVDALRIAGAKDVARARIIGAGATAASALVAAAELGAAHIEVRARRPEAARALVGLAEPLGVDVSAARLGDGQVDAVDVTIATLPSGTVLDSEVAADLASDGGLLLDAAYAPWPSALAATWAASAPESTVVSGFEMLLHQAVRQIRIFLGGAQDAPLPDEDVILSVMRSATMGD